MTCNNLLWDEHKVPLTWAGKMFLLQAPACAAFPWDFGCLAGQDHRGTTCRAPDTSPSSHPCSLQMLRPCKTLCSPLPSAHRKQKKGFSSLPQAADEDLMGQSYKPALKYQNSSQPLTARQPRSQRCSLHIEPVPSFILSSHTTTLQEAAELG